MNKFSSRACLTALTLLSPAIAHATAASDCTARGGYPGILVDCRYPTDNFMTYVVRLLGTEGIGPFILFAATGYIVYSGLEYMLSGVSDTQKKAKERIRGVLIGIIAYALVILALRVLDGGLGTFVTRTP